MNKILFTKEFNITELQKSLGNNFVIESLDFIQTKAQKWSQISNCIESTSSEYIVSSARAAKLIQDLPNSANFYVVGEKSRKILEKAGYHVAFTAEYADDLVNYILLNFKKKTIFNFFCSQIRRDTIPKGLALHGHIVNEIITYNTSHKKVQLINDFDAYVFYSPSAVDSFREQYIIPEKARIFAIGKTTAQAIQEQLGKEAEYPETPDQKTLLQFIKTKGNAKK